MAVSYLAYSLTLIWERHVPPKRRITFNGLHGVISQKVQAILTTAVRSSDRTQVRSVSVLRINQNVDTQVAEETGLLYTILYICRRSKRHFVYFITFYSRI
jgi:hypothetical protein